MPRYRITAPDGRSVLVEGNQAPTEQDIAAIFGNYQQPKQDNYSALDKAQYMGRAAGEGLTFGLGDIVGGITNTVAAPIGKTVGAITEGNPLALSDFNPWQNFKQGRKDFVREQKGFAEEHPYLNFTGELGGGLVTGIAGAGKKIASTAGKQGIKALMSQSAKEGAKFGLAYGAGSGLTENENSLSVQDALKGGGTGFVSGAALGAAMAPAVYGVGKVAGGIRNLKNKDIRAIEKMAGLDASKSVQEGIPLIDRANEGVMDLALGTKNADPKAAQIYADYARARQGKSLQNVSEGIDTHFGNKGYSQLIEEMDAKALEAYQPAYEKAMFQKNGLPKRIDFNATIDEADYIGKVRRTTGLKTEVRGLADNDMRVLDYAKQLMDDDINKAVNQGDNAKVRALTKLKNEFLKKIDEKNPEYAAARKIFADNKAAQDLMAQGQKIGQGSQSERAIALAKLTDQEKGYYRQGVREALLKKLNTQKSEGGNVSRKIFDYDTMQRLKNVGLSDYDALAALAKRENIASANMQRLLQGSQTAEKEASLGRWFTNPNRQAKGLIARTIDSLYGKVVRPNPLEVAKMLTDPKYLAQRLQASGGISSIAGRGAGQVGSMENKGIVKSAVNKLKEEGGFAWKDSASRMPHLNENEVLLKLPQSKRQEFLAFVDKDSNHTVANSRFAEKYLKLKNSLNANSMEEVFEKASPEDRKVLGEALDNLNKSYEEAYEKFINPQGLPPKAFYNGIKLGKQLVKGHWSKGGHVEGDDIITFYAKDYKPSNLEKYFDVRNNTDLMTDYFDKDKIDFRPGDKFYKQALEAFNAQTNRRNKKLGITDIIANKLKEEGGYAMKPLDKTVNSLGEPVAKTGEGVKNFNKWFKGSKVVDEQGKPLVMYHGTPNATFEEFKPGTYFTPNKEYADKYHRQGASYLGVKNSAEKPGTYETYLSIKKPFDTRDKEARDIFYKYYYGQRGVGSDLSEKGLPDWMEGEDLIEFLTTEGKKFGYDGLILDEGGTGGYGQEVIDRGISYLPFKANQVKSVKNRGTFSKKDNNIYKALIGGVGISQILRNKGEQNGIRQ